MLCKHGRIFSPILQGWFYRDKVCIRENGDPDDWRHNTDTYRYFGFKVAVQ